MPAGTGHRRFFRRFLSAEDRATLRPLMKLADKSGSKIQVLLKAGDGSANAGAHLDSSAGQAWFQKRAMGMVVTDMTESRRTEELLRALTNRVVQLQEAGAGARGLVLHDNITQLLCAVVVRCQTLADMLSSRDGTSKKEAIKLRKMLGQTAEEVERHFARSAAQRIGRAGAGRGPARHRHGVRGADGVSLKLTCVELTARLPAATEWRSSAFSRKL